MLFIGLILLVGCFVVLRAPLLCAALLIAVPIWYAASYASGVVQYAFLFYAALVFMGYLLLVYWRPSRKSRRTV
jgi:hypothetical protein